MSLEETLRQGFDAFGRGDYQRSADLARAVLREAPDNAGGLTLTGRLALMSHRLDVALSIFASLTENPTPPEIWLDLARTLVALRRDEEAAEAARGATKLDPDSVAAHLFLGEILMSLNDRAGAAEAYRRVIALDVAETRAHLGMARAADLGVGSPEGARMHALLKETKLGHQRHAHLHYALSFIHKRAGDSQKFIQHMFAANAAQKAWRPGTRKFYEETFDRLERAFSRDNFIKAIGGGQSDPAPIFIVGKPRSGTTLVEQIIGGHPKVATGGELNYVRAVVTPEVQRLTGRPFPEGWETLGGAKMVGIARPFTHLLGMIAQGKPFVTDKTPGNFHALGFLFLLFANRTVISVRRDAMDTAFSTLQQHFDDRSPHTYDIDLLAYAYYRYERLMHLWETTFGSKIHTVRYEELVAKPEEQGKALLRACGLDWDSRFLDVHAQNKAVHTLSMQQVRRPVNIDSVGAWRKYERELEPLRKALEAQGLIAK